MFLLLYSKQTPQEDLVIRCRRVAVTFLPCQHLLCTGLDWSFYSTKERKAGPNFFVPSPFFWEFCSQEPPSQLLKQGGKSFWWKNIHLANNNSNIETKWFAHHLLCLWIYEQEINFFIADNEQEKTKKYIHFHNKKNEINDNIKIIMHTGNTRPSRTGVIQK